MPPSSFSYLVASAALNATRITSILSLIPNSLINSDIVKQEELRHTYFPLGDMEKDETRKLAEKAGLVTAAKHDSQDICFVPDGDYASFIEHINGRKYASGNFIDADGNVIGTHREIGRAHV